MGKFGPYIKMIVVQEYIGTTADAFGGGADASVPIDCH